MVGILSRTIFLPLSNSTLKIEANGLFGISYYEYQVFTIYLNSAVPLGGSGGSKTPGAVQRKKLKARTPNALVRFFGATFEI